MDGDESKKSNSTKRCVIKQKIKILKIALKQINLKMKQTNKNKTKFTCIVYEENFKTL